ncbi:MAG TPA: selenium metabolism-associated LysR family transcriptional regulator [Gaiellaceae bacterium]
MTTAIQHQLIVNGYQYHVEMDERRLEVFVAVARRLSFSDAARSLHLSQPAVSQHVAALEADLGAQLFERTTRRVRLTSAGAALLDRAESLLREHAEARRAVAAAEGRIAGELSVAASLTIGGYVLPRALAELRRRHPELLARVTIENTEQVIGSLRGGRADIGFVEGEQRDTGVDYHLLRDDELVLIAPAKHRFAHMTEVPVADLATEPMVLREQGSGTRTVAETHLQNAGVDLEALRIVAELSGIDAIKAAVAAGLGVSIISRSALTDSGAAAEVIHRRIAGVRMHRQMAAATLTGTTPLPAAQRLLALLRRQASEP